MSIDAKPLSKDGNRTWKITTEPTVEPITVDEVKIFARIDGVDEDSLIEGFIKTVRELTEAYLGRALITQTITMLMDYWPNVDAIEFPRPPLQSVTSVSTVDEDDSETVFSSDNYYVITESIPGKLVIKQGCTAPINTDRYVGGFKFVFVAGYGDTAVDTPSSIKDGMKLWVANAYENRAVNTEPPPSAKPLLDLHKVVGFGMV